MSIACTICGTWYSTAGSDRLDICPTCWEANFAGAQPPLDWAAPQVEGTVTLTPRQVQALHRMHQRGQAREDTPC